MAICIVSPLFHCIPVMYVRDPPFLPEKSERGFSVTENRREKEKKERKEQQQPWNYTRRILSLAGIMTTKRASKRKRRRMQSGRCVCVCVCNNKAMSEKSFKSKTERERERKKIEMKQSTV